MWCWSGLRIESPELEGRHIGRQPLTLDRAAILQDRKRGRSLRELAKSYGVSRATIHRVVHTPDSTETVAQFWSMRPSSLLPYID